MSNDIEDFLKRAAQRRQVKSSQPSPQPASSAPRPEYTSARSERIPRNRGDEDLPIEAILIEEPLEKESVAKQLRAAEQQRSQAARITAARRAGGTVKPVQPAVASPRVPPERAPSVAPQTARGDNMGFVAVDRLVTMLQKPEGMLQAILLQEVLQRPEHRW